MPNGPYVQAAAFCDRVLEGKDDVLSAIRIVDRWFLSRPSPQQTDAPPPSISATLLVMLKSGDARGSHDIRIRMERPDGIKDDGFTISGLFEGEDRGVNLILPMTIQVEQAGIYWFDIEIDSVVLTRAPIRVVFQTLPAGQETVAPSDA